MTSRSCVRYWAVHHVTRAVSIDCDGASFTGFQADPVSVGDLPPEYPYPHPTPANATVYIRGRVNLAASLDYIQTHLLQGASVEELVV